MVAQWSTPSSRQPTPTPKLALFALFLFFLSFAPFLLFSRSEIRKHSTVRNCVYSATGSAPPLPPPSQWTHANGVIFPRTGGAFCRRRSSRWCLTFFCSGRQQVTPVSFTAHDGWHPGIFIRFFWVFFFSNHNPAFPTH